MQAKPFRPEDKLICKSCSTTLTGKYCSQCGEKVITNHDKSVLHLVEEAFHFVTHFEGTFFTTLKTLATRPGKVSLDYCEGIRKKYFKPLSLFLLLVVIYLLFPVFEGLNMKLKFHINSPFYGTYARQQIDHLLQNGMEMKDVILAFQAKSVTISKFLLLIIIPLLALALWPFTFKRRKYFFDQMVFSAEINSVFLLWGFLVLPVIVLLLLKVNKFFTGNSLAFNDDLSGLLIIIPLCIYVGFASGRFYKLNFFYSLGVTIVFFFAHNFIVHFIYKFILFNAVIKTI